MHSNRKRSAGLPAFALIFFPALLSTAAAAAPGAPVPLLSATDAASAPATASKPAKPKKVCRMDRSSTSRLAARICKTASEWERQADEGGEKLKPRDTGAPR